MLKPSSNVSLVVKAIDSGAAPSGRLAHWMVVAACCYGMMTISFVNAGHAFWLPSVAEDLHLSRAAAGLFLSLAFWGMVAAILVAGPLADRYGFRALLVTSAVCQALGLILVSSASSELRAYAGVCLASFGTGAILALATPVACGLYPAIRTGLCNLLQSFCSAGAVVAALLAMWLLDGDGAWRLGYRWTAALAIPYGLAFLVLPLPPRAFKGAERLRTRRLVRQAPFVVLLVGTFLVAFTFVGVTMWLPGYVDAVAGATRRVGGVAMILCAAAAVLGNWFNSCLSLRLGPRPLVVAGGLLSVAALLMLQVTTQPLFVLSCFALMAMGSAGLSPAILGNAGDQFPSAGASMYALLMASGNLGAAVGPMVIGLVAQCMDLPTAITMTAVGPAGAVVLLLTVLPRRGVCFQPPQQA